jgi:hypothetical protein
MISIHLWYRPFLYTGVNRSQNISLQKKQDAESSDFRRCPEGNDADSSGVSSNEISCHNRLMWRKEITGIWSHGYVPWIRIGIGGQSVANLVPFSYTKRVGFYHSNVQCYNFESRLEIQFF